MGWRDFAKQVAVGNPAAGLAVEGDTVKQLIEAQKATPDLLDKFIGRQEDRDTDRLLGEMQRVDTGNPLLDEQKRKDIYTARGLGFFDQGEINTAMPLMEAAGHLQYKQNITTEDDIRTQRSKVADRTQLRELPDFNDPNFKGAAEAQIKSNRVEGLITPGVDAKYLEHFKSHPFALKTNKEHTQYPEAPTAILDAVGVDNFNDPLKYTTKARDQAINTIADNLGIQYPGITDRKVLKARAVDLLALDPAGRKFDLRMADEAKETYGSVRMDEYSGALATSMGNVAGMSLAKNTQAEMTAASQAVTKDVNAIFTHMKKFGVSPKQEARIMPSILQALATTDIIPGSGRRAGFGESRKILEKIYNAEDIAKGLKPNGAARLRAALDGKITVGAQSKLRQALRRIYQDRFKNNIPNKILDLQVDTILNEDKVLSTAMSIGRKDAEATALHREEVSKSHRASRLASTKKLNEMLGTGVDGTPLNTIYKDTLARLKDEDTDLKPEDRAKLRKQMQSVYRRMRGYFVEGNNLQLNNEGHEALLLGLRRMFVNNVGAQEENTFWRALGFLADFGILTPGGEMTKGQGNEQLPMLELLYENLPIPERTAPHVKDGLEDLQDKLGARITKLKNEAKASLLNSGGKTPYPVPQTNYN
jgi:hypothetical protein